MSPEEAKKRAIRLAKTGQLTKLREALGLSQSDVGRHLGLDPSTVSRWESGENRPRPAHATALLEFLEVE